MAAYAPSSSVTRPGAADDPEPGVGARQHRPEPRQQEDAGLHHRRRVQIGRHRRRRRHRVRQPEVERELRALGQRAEQDQHERRRVERMRRGSGRPRPAPHRGRSCRRCGRAAARRRTGSPPVAVTVSAMRAPSRARRRVVPVADQQEREEARQLPEEGELHQVAREHHAQHRAHEGEQEGEEARHRVVGRHVVARIEHDERADPGDQHRRTARRSRPCAAPGSGRAKASRRTRPAARHRADTAG